MDSPGDHRRIHGVRRLLALLSLAAGIAGLAMAVTRPVQLVAAGDDRSEDLVARGDERLGAAARTHPFDARRERPAGPRARPSVAAGLPWAGTLRHGRLLPAKGRGYLTWDPILKRSPNRAWRRHGTAHLVRMLERVLAPYAARLVLVGDLSRPHGGDFGPRFGGIGHASHQNGLDADVYYPRRDRRPKPPRIPGQVDLDAAQRLVDAFLAAGATRIFVGPSLNLHGPPAIVQPLPHHDNHLHVRLPNP